MPEPVPADAAAASWSHLEHVVERLHAAARSPLGVREFYRRLLDEAGSAMGAVSSAAWRVLDDGRAEIICREKLHASETGSDLDGQLPATPTEAVLQVATQREAAIETLSGPPRGRRRAATATASFDRLLCPVLQPGGVEDALGRAPAVGVFQLIVPGNAAPMVRQGWLELAATIAEIASDFHALDELRRLREGASLHRQAAEILRRINAPRELGGTALEIANEGRRALGCDRLSVVVRRGRRWRLLSVSGVARVDRRQEFAGRMERLAAELAKWGEPVEHPPAEGEEDWPPRLARAIAAHVDLSQARELASAPVSFGSHRADDHDEGRSARRTRKVDAVLVAEQFDGAGGAPLRSLVELADLCGPALARSAALDRFPLRTMLRWSERLAFLQRPAQVLKRLLLVGAAAAAAAALVYVPADFNVEAPARLRTAVERDVFATATGAVEALRVSHGQQVAQGDVLAVISDPELALKLQQVRGEIDAVRKRLDALAVTRTDRTLEENTSAERLPLAAEQRQLEEQVASLELQRKLLETRREQLTIRSPIAGQVLTHDVEALLESRPVERGQALLTIADTASGWELVADVPQRHVGHVLEAMKSGGSDVAADVRLTGDVEQSYPGHVTEVSAAMPLDAAGLEDASQPVPVRISVDGSTPAAARPGMAAAVQIHCGRRSLGYVWLHDVAATVYRWATF